MKNRPWPWDVVLNNVIGEVVAEDMKREHGVSGRQEPMAGLAGIFGIREEIRRRACRRLAQRINLEPINAAAKQRLPPDWGGDDGELFVLSLMLWGLNEGGLAAPSYWETEDAVGGLIAEMGRWNPAFVMAILENPESPESADEAVCFSADNINQAEDAESAAAILLQSLEEAANAGHLNKPIRVAPRRRSRSHGLTKVERQILGPLIKGIVRYYKDSWGQLKREIWDLGHQSYYVAQGDFLAPIERAISRIPSETRTLLSSEWRAANPRRDDISDSNFVAVYTLFTLEELIRRAKVAAYRTCNWDE